MHTRDRWYSYALRGLACVALATVVSACGGDDGGTGDDLFSGFAGSGGELSTGGASSGGDGSLAGGAAGAPVGFLPPTEEGPDPVELDPGTTAPWTIPALPESDGPVRPMTCQWLDSDNCWKRMARQAQACAPDGAGSLNEERDACTYPGGETLRFGGALSELKDNDGTTIFITNHRLLDDQGEPCFTAKIQGIGKGSFSSATESVVMRSTGVTTYQVTCPDGTTYDSDAEGACSDIGLRWLLGGLPGEVLACNNADRDCRLELTGTDTGRRALAECSL